MFDLLLGRQPGRPQGVYRRTQATTTWTCWMCPDGCVLPRKQRVRGREVTWRPQLERKKRPLSRKKRRASRNAAAEIPGAGIVMEQPITQTLETNYMPYAMSVIVSRAIPEIDGFKPAHRKLLYTMYKMGLLKRQRAPSPPTSWARPCSSTPTGTPAIYETDGAPLARANQALAGALTWTPRATSARRTPGIWPALPPVYTEVEARRHLRRAASGHRQGHRGLCGQLRQHHEGAHAAARHLPRRSWSTANTGHRRGYGQSSICSFNLRGGLRDHHCAFLRTRTCDITSTLQAPDFPSAAGYILYTRGRFGRIYDTGRAALRVARPKYRYDKKAKLHGDYRDPAHHHGRGHHGQDRRARQSGHA